MNYKFITITSFIVIQINIKVFSQNASNLFNEKYIIRTTEKVCDWQFNHLYTETALKDGRTEAVPETGWIRGVFYTGVMAAYRVTENTRYLDSVYRWGEKNHWQLGRRKKHADDQVVAQTYADIYLQYHHSYMLEPTRSTFDYMLETPQPAIITGWSKRKNWSWCDALFMAPPAMVKLGVIDNKPEYIYLMNNMWWETYHHLYSEQDSLFYRDKRYIIKPDGSGIRTTNKKKVFWGRGNGWVLAGLAKTLHWLPEGYTTRPAFEKVFIEMATKISTLQHEDGLWRSSLHDPEEYPMPEASSSAFFCFGIAWGINNGYLDKEQFLPVVEKAWRGLNNILHKSGKIGYVQQVGHDPQSVSKDDSMEYGAAAFILAAEQVLQLVKNNSFK